MINVQCAKCGRVFQTASEGTMVACLACGNRFIATGSPASEEQATAGQAATPQHAAADSASYVPGRSTAVARWTAIICGTLYASGTLLAVLGLVSFLRLLLLPEMDVPARIGPFQAVSSQMSAFTNATIFAGAVQNLVIAAGGGLLLVGLARLVQVMSPQQQ
jgi:DNA-directed RNA polymerase subunit RPC12/RpoP